MVEGILVVHPLQYVKLVFFLSFSFSFPGFPWFELKWNNKIKCGIADNCTMIENERNAKWEETISNGEIIVGECLNGYQGFATRSCIQYGSIANWTSVSGSCNGILSFLFSFFLFFSFFSFFSDWKKKKKKRH